jgi:hypothetical protein
MITHLTSELNRINQEILLEEECKYPNPDEDRQRVWRINVLKNKKETLKKVSLMWANGMLKKIEKQKDEFCINLGCEDERVNTNSETQICCGFCNWTEREICNELKQIKSLMDSQGESQDKINNGGQNGN